MHNFTLFNYIYYTSANFLTNFSYFILWFEKNVLTLHTQNLTLISMIEIKVPKVLEDGTTIEETFVPKIQFAPKDVIKKTGLTNAEIARKLGVSPPAVIQMINGNASAQTILKLAWALDVDPRDLFVDTETNDTVSPTLRKEIACPYCSKRFLLLD